MLNRRTLIMAAATVPLLTARAGAEMVRLPSELVSEIDLLPSRAVLGAAAPDVTLYEFFDYNCGYCRQSALEIAELLRADKNLRYVLINFAVLSEESILASRIAIAFLKQKPKGYLAFHEQLFRRKGRIGAEEAIEAALTLGANEKKLVEDSNSKATTETLIKTVRLGDSLGFSATPSYVTGAEGNIGFLDLERKRSVIAAMRQCERMVCG